MGIAELGARGHLAQTNLHAVLAAGRKGAAGRRIQQIHRGTLDGHKALVLCSVQLGDGVDQTLGVLVTRLVEDLVGSAVLHNVAGVHDGDLLAHGSHNAQIVGDHDDAHAQLLAQILHQLKDLCLNGHVQCGGGLVSDQQLRLTGQCNGDHHALAHTAGQLVGVLLQTLFGLVDANQLQQLLGACPCIGLVLIGVQADDLHDLVADGVHRVQAGHGVLEDDGDLVAADLAEVLLLHVLDLVAVEPHLAAHQLTGVSGQAHNGVGGDRLTGAGLAHNAQNIALIHGKGNAVQCLYFARRGEERKAFFFDIKNFLAHFCSPHQFFSFGSKASRRPSPNRLNTRIITLIISAGAISRWG